MEQGPVLGKTISNVSKAKPNITQKQPIVLEPATAPNPYPSLSVNLQTAASDTTILEGLPQKAKRTPCKRGTRRNKKTGNCDPIVPIIPIIPIDPIMSNQPNALPQPVVQEPLEQDNQNISQNIDQAVEGQQENLDEDLEQNQDEAPQEPISETIQKPAPQPSVISALDKDVVKDLYQPLNPLVTGLVKPKDPKKLILDDLFPTLDEGSNDFLRKKEKVEYDTRSQHTEFPHLYPDLDDPNFALKIAQRKEFNDTKFDGTIKSIQEQADKMCAAEFELLPHQIFVKNFLSFQTPYNSLLLYHGLGSGKTCSAIGIAEEMRSYMKQVGIKQRIIVVASPNVQSNFRMQLFDERRLKEVDGMWSIHSCIGDALIREINPTSLKGVPRERVISQIKTIINQYYVFMGYVELANFIAKKTSVPEKNGFTAEDQKRAEIQNIKRVFSNRLIIIDEVHNIRMTDENKDWKTGQALMKLAKYCSNMRLLMLSATPMYNSPKEIIWLVNLMNLNDKRATITADEVFDKSGEFREAKKAENGQPLEESGQELLHRKLIGYVSYIRGENPYTFPYRIYPSDFAPEQTFAEPGSALGSLAKAAGSLAGQAIPKQITLPTFNLIKYQITEPMENLPVYVSKIGTYQEQAYRLIIDAMRQEVIPTFDTMDRFGFRRLQTPLEALNIVYPSRNLDALIAKHNANVDNSNRSSDMSEFSGSEPPKKDRLTELKEDSYEDDENVEDDADDTDNADKDPLSSMVGKRGMRTVMNYVDDSKKKIPLKHSFAYKPEILENYGRIFDSRPTINPETQRPEPSPLSKYSSKMNRICQIIRHSTGIVLIYSQYIDGGIVPMALALEEMGFTRYSSSATKTPSLFANPPIEPLDALTMKPRSKLAAGGKFTPAKYVMITGDKAFSPHNAEEIKNITSADNKSGEVVKVVLISKAGSEGLDFKCIRQIHIIEPWYNLNRIEQIIGRGVRNLSHCMLREFSQRNVEIYMHATVLKTVPLEEAADVYVYRLAKKKAEQIGKVTRLLKETSVDCILNISQTNFTVDKINALAANQNIELVLSTGQKRIKYKIGDRPHTDVCDYSDCNMQCKPNAAMSGRISQDTYSTEYANMNNGRLMQRIRQIFRDERGERDGKGEQFYKFSELITFINVTKQYPIDQIYSALTAFVKNKTEFLVDRYGRRGNLINKGDIYAFQPIEINDEAITVFERAVPIDVKRAVVNLEVPKEFPQPLISGIKMSDGLKVGPGSPRGIGKSTQGSDEAYFAIITDFKEKLHNATTVQELGQGDRDWYKNAGLVFNHLQVVRGLNVKDIVRFIIQHMVDVLLPSDKLTLISHFYSKVREEELTDEVEQEVKNYLDSKMINVENLTGFLIADKTNWKIYIQTDDLTNGSDEQKIWSEAGPEDIHDFEESGNLDDTFKVDPLTFSPIIGFINMFKSGKEMVFRTKDLNQKQNNTGTRIDALIKADVVKRLNEVLEYKTKPNDKTKLEDTIMTTEQREKAPKAYNIGRTKDKTADILQMGMCVILEMVLRQRTEDEFGGKVWFLNPEQAMYNKIAKYPKVE